MCNCQLFLAFVGCLAAGLPAAAQGKIQPYYVKQILNDYTANVRGTRILARRSDGARVTVDSVVLGKADYPLNSPAYSRELILPDGQSLRLVDGVKAKSTWPQIPAVDMAYILGGLANPAPDCGVAGDRSKIVGHDLVEGLETLVKQDTSVAGRKSMQWVVPALGCVAVRSNVQLLAPNGPPFMAFETKLVRVFLEEPEGNLFYTGSDYTEMRPSRAVDLQQTALNITVPDRVGASLDQKYVSRAPR